MKYWNKDKDVRRRCWTRIEIPLGRHSKQELKRWCQQQASRGKFYYYYGNSAWWFEDPKDATWFLMNWS